MLPRFTGFIRFLVDNDKAYVPFSVSVYMFAGFAAAMHTWVWLVVATVYVVFVGICLHLVKSVERLTADKRTLELTVDALQSTVTLLRRRHAYRARRSSETIAGVNEQFKILSALLNGQLPAPKIHTPPKYKPGTRKLRFRTKKTASTCNEDK